MASTGLTCPRCALDPTSHNFETRNLIQGITYYYTAPARATYRIRTNEAYAEFKTHLDQARKSGRWAWIFDCSGMGMEHYATLNFLSNLVNTLIEEHDQALEDVIILHPSIIIRGAVMAMWPIMNANLHRKIRFVDTKRELDLELMAKAYQRGHP
jgi:hypothetical protein